MNWSEAGPTDPTLDRLERSWSDWSEEDATERSWTNGSEAG